MIFPIPATVINAEVLHCLYFFRSAAALGGRIMIHYMDTITISLSVLAAWL